MTNATIADPDPTMDALVPRQSSWRNWALVLVALGVVVVAWWSPAVLRPTIQSPGDAGGGTSYLMPFPYLVTYMPVSVEGWPSVQVRSVAGVPGLRVDGAWLVDDAVFDPVDGAESAAYDTPLASVHARYPGVRLDGTTALPQVAGDGPAMHLVVLFEIVECAAALSVAPAAEPGLEVTLRTAIGTEVVRTFDAFGLVIDAQLLSDAVFCDAN